MSAKKACRVATLGLVFMVLLLGVGCGCGPSEPPGEGLAVYLLADDLPPSQLAMASHLTIADTALISSDDIVSYFLGTHRIEVTAAAYFAVRDLSVPLTGRSFAVCVDRRPIYPGAFVTPLWSGSFDGVVIQVPMKGGTSADSYMLELELGYPGLAAFTGQDPRADPSIIEQLERAGKLK